MSVCCTNNSQYIIKAHNNIGQDNGSNGAAQCLAALDFLFAIVLACDKTHTDPEKNYGAHRLQERNLHEISGNYC